MRYLMVVLCVMMLSGCYIHQHAEMQRKAAKENTEYYSKHFGLEKKFLDCMVTFGKEKVSSPASTPDIAEAAVKNCEGPLAYYRLNQGNYYSTQYVATGYPPFHETGNFAQRDTDNLAAKGKDLVMREVAAQRVK